MKLYLRTITVRMQSRETKMSSNTNAASVLRVSRLVQPWVVTFQKLIQARVMLTTTRKVSENYAP